MYVFQHTGQLSIEEFYSPFGGKFDPNNRWVLLQKLIPWIPLEGHRIRPLRQQGLDEPLGFAVGSWVYGLVRFGVSPSDEQASRQGLER